MKSQKFVLALVILLNSFALMAQERVREERPYIVHDKTNKITRVEVRKDVKGTQNVIQISASNASGGANIATRSAALAAAEITSVNIITGSYNQTREISKTSRGMSLELLDVVFPCRVRVTITDQVLDIEIKEPGYWKVTVGMVN